MNGSVWYDRAERLEWGSGYILANGMNWLRRSSPEGSSANGVFASTLLRISLRCWSGSDTFPFRLTFHAKTGRLTVSGTRLCLPVNEGLLLRQPRAYTSHPKFSPD